MRPPGEAAVSAKMINLKAWAEEVAWAVATSALAFYVLQPIVGQLPQ